MKKKHRKYYSISHTILVDSKRPIVLEPKNDMMQPRQAVGEGIIAVMDGLNWYGEHINNVAVNQEINAHMAGLEIGEQKTVTISYGGGQAKTVFQTSGHPHTIGPKSNSRRTYYLTGRSPRNQKEFESWVGAKIQKDYNSGNIKSLPADSNFDRSYQNSRERFNGGDRDFGRGFDNAPRGDFNTGGERDTMWA